MHRLLKDTLHFTVRRVTLYLRLRTLALLHSSVCINMAVVVSAVKQVVSCCAALVVLAHVELSHMACSDAASALLMMSDTCVLL
jgi:hypothetical protein